MVVQCPMCGRYVKNAQPQPDGTWKGICRECGDVTGDGKK